MADKADKVGPQGTQVFELSEIESILTNASEQNASSIDVKPALIGINEPMVGHQVVLEQQKYRIGRSEENEIIVNETSVSSSHAQMVFRDGQWRIINLLSSNGTYVNGEKIAESILFPGDQIRLGNVEFMFINSDDVDISNNKTASKPINAFTKTLLSAGFILIIFVLLGYIIFG